MGGIPTRERESMIRVLTRASQSPNKTPSFSHQPTSPVLRVPAHASSQPSLRSQKPAHTRLLHLTPPSDHVLLSDATRELSAKKAPPSDHRPPSFLPPPLHSSSSLTHPPPPPPAAPPASTRLVLLLAAEELTERGPGPQSKLRALRPADDKLLAAGARIDVRLARERVEAAHCMHHQPLHRVLQLHFRALDRPHQLEVKLLRRPVRHQLKPLVFHRPLRRLVSVQHRAQPRLKRRQEVGAGAAAEHGFDLAVEALEEEARVVGGLGLGLGGLGALAALEKLALRVLVQRAELVPLLHVVAVEQVRQRRVVVQRIQLLQLVLVQLLPQQVVVHPPPMPPRPRPTRAVSALQRVTLQHRAAHTLQCRRGPIAVLSPHPVPDLGPLRLHQDRRRWAAIPICSIGRHEVDWCLVLRVIFANESNGGEAAGSGDGGVGRHGNGLFCWNC
mmetsp:Transcript_5381/g.13007  ORF Transcript_5381/g.13007 Transcript_5381/m.13007 type:complete len:445 (-) Transcript_5381:96-1430(-)